MNIKHNKTNTIIKMTKDEETKCIERINDLDSSVTTMIEAQDMWLSDLHKLEGLKYELINMFDLVWNKETYRYIRRENSYE